MRFIKPRRPVSKVYIHCSASDNPDHDNAATIDAWHKANGWAGIGYHFFIRKDGLVEIGRDIEKTPAAQGGHNRGTIAICLHGLKKNKFTKEQFASLGDLCKQINEAYRGGMTFHGHCEVSAKTCPVFDYGKVLNLDARGKINGSVLVDPMSSGLEYADPAAQDHSILRNGDKGRQVEALQKQLVDLGYHVGNIDGHFGNRTRDAVLSFQADNHLITDGLVGKMTFEALDDAKPRKIADARATATVGTLAEKGSRIADASVKGSGAGALTICGGIIAYAGKASDEFQKILAQVEPIAAPFGGLSTILLVGLLGVVAFMTWQSIRAGRARAADHRSGKTS